MYRERRQRKKTRQGNGRGTKYSTRVNSKRFKKILKEQDDELDVDIDVTDTEAADAELDTMSSDDLGADTGDVATSTTMTDQQRQMFEELKSWVEEMDKFAEYVGSNVIK